MGCEYFGPAAYNDPNLARLIQDWRASCKAEGRYPRAVPLNKMYALYCCDLNCFPPRPKTGLQVTVTPKQAVLLNKGGTVKLAKGEVTLRIIKEEVKRKRATRPKSVFTKRKTTAKKPAKKKQSNQKE